MATIAVSAIGCAGEDATVPSETMELPTPPPSEMPEVLDLEAMSDEELLAEARRSYQGWLDDVEEMRASGSDNYLALDEWTTANYRDTIQGIFDVHLPDGAYIEGAQSLIGVELAKQQSGDEGAVEVNICLDNTTADYFDAEGTDIKREDAPDTSVGSATLLLSPDETRLLIDSETKTDKVGESLCGS